MSHCLLLVTYYRLQTCR